LRFDAVLNGLTIQALTSEAVLDGRQIRDEVIRTLFPQGAAVHAVPDGPGERMPVG
jgi:hypothetical protein